jgi:hypothetical protein
MLGHGSLGRLLGHVAGTVAKHNHFRTPEIGRGSRFVDRDAVVATAFRETQAFAAEFTAATDH